MFFSKALLLVLVTFVLITNEADGQYPAAAVATHAARSFLNPNPDGPVVLQYAPGPFRLPRQMNFHKQYLEHLLPVGAPSVMVKLAAMVDKGLGSVFALVKRIVYSGIGVVVSLFRAFLPISIYEAVMPRGLARFASPKRPDAEFHRIL
ncbi:uncharacterized protein LOC143201031 [Rhynchophorus ferrugineus]|uniref:Uncharacterized protein n=1 Tax=Rhynchophorus ferrugineus TaxID=354439 RepID=A0A834MBK4_RHYFE|nr:hypothetical protein GWI33_007883 [Rhynchophorus ferrugineus]